MNAPSAPSPFPHLAEDLQAHLRLCEEIQEVVREETRVLTGGRDAALLELLQQKKALLPRLNLSLDKIRQHRAGWQRLSARERAAHTGIQELLQRNQDLVMKIIFLDRENEQVLLRRGLVPTPHLPPANRQRPHFVADLYRRAGAPG